MAKARVIGIDLFEQDLARMEDHTEQAIGAAIYEGARILANEVSAQLAALPIEEQNAYGTFSNPMRGIKLAQLQGLQRSFGIARMRKINGTYDEKMGFDGYNQVKTDKYPSGQPNAMIARAIESGTSFRAKHPFLSKAYQRARRVSEDSMRTVFESFYE